MSRASTTMLRDGMPLLAGCTAGVAGLSSLSNRVRAAATTSRWVVLPATLSTMFFGTYHVPMWPTKSSLVRSCTVSTVPSTGQPIGWSPKQATVRRRLAQALGWS